MAEDGRDGNGVDLISSLPDVILQHILSFNETRFVVRTSALSKRWRHVWSDAPSLSFFDSYRCTVKAESIDETLDRYTARKMTSFQLRVSTIRNIVPYIDKWISLATFRNVESMSLDLGFPNDRYFYKIPDSFFVNSSIKQLSIELRSSRLKIPSCLVSWTSLEKLSFRCCNLSDKCLAKILSGCPIIKSLNLYCCQNLIVVDLSKSPSLKELRIRNNAWMPGPRKIVAPHIHRLRLRNAHEFPCTLVDVSSLTEARLNISFASTKRLRNDILQVGMAAQNMLEKLQNVEKITFGANFLKVLSLDELRCVPFPMFKVKSLTFKTVLSHDMIPDIARVVRNSPELKKLTLNTKNHDTRMESYLEEIVFRELHQMVPTLCHKNNVSVMLS